METKPISKKAVNVFATLFRIGSKIGQACAVIGLFFMIICAIAVPILGTNIKIGNNKVTAFKQTVKYEADTEKDQIVLTYEGKEYRFTPEFDDEIISLNSKTIVDEFNKLSVKRLTVAGEIICIYIIVALIATEIILGKIYKVFKSIKTDDTVFLNSNVEHLRTISKVIVIQTVLLAILAIALEIVAKQDVSLNIGGYSLSTAMLTYIMAWAIDSGIKNSEVSIPKQK